MMRGNKVSLRPLERTDLQRLHDLEQHVELVLLGDGQWEPQSLPVFEKMFERNLAAEEQRWFVIEADAQVIGSVGLHHCNRFSGSTSFGIGINDPAYVGKGYGREAIALLLDWAFRIQNWRRVWLDVSATNERAVRAYRGLGFVEEGRQRQQVYTNGGYVDLIVMGLLRHEWEEQRQSSA